MITSNEGPLLAVFAAVARAGSFSAAAATLGLSKSVVSERVRMLEERCGARLLERTTRRVRLTAAGAEVLDATTKVEDSLGLLSRSLDESRAEPTGELRVSTTNDLGALLVAPTVARFVAAYPKVRVDILAEDSARDLIETGIDVAVRLGAPKSSSFVARKLAVLEEPIVAAPSLAGQLGAAARPERARGRALGAPLAARQRDAALHRARRPKGRAEADVSSAGEHRIDAAELALARRGRGRASRARDPRARARAEVVVLCPGWSWKQWRCTRSSLRAPRSTPRAERLSRCCRISSRGTGARWSPERAAP
jgi:DNA-binding transcriptional LysR family regulator